MVYVPNVFYMLHPQSSGLFSGTKAALTQSLTYFSNGCRVCGSTVDYFRKRQFAFLRSSFWQAPCGWQTTSGCFQQLLAQISLAVSPDCSDWIGRIKRQGPREGVGLRGWHSVEESVNGGFYGDHRSVMWPCTLIRVALRRWTQRSHLSRRTFLRWKAHV